MEKSQKKVFVEKIKKTLDDVGIIVITHYSGLKTSETDELRLKLREVGGSLQITKNSLMQIALKDNKNKELKSLFNGPIAIAYSKDEISAAKVAVSFSKEHDKLIILGGLLVGIGTKIGNGCTSGHGICGISRFSIRSFVATIIFMLMAMLSVIVIKLLGIN